MKKEGHFFSCSIFGNIILASRSYNTPHLYIAAVLQPSSQLKSVLIGSHVILVLMKCKSLITFDLNKNRSDLMIIIEH